MKQYKNTINTNAHITKTTTHYKTHTYTHPNTHTHTHTHTHTLQNPHTHTPTHTHTHITKPTHTHTHTLQSPHTHTHTLQNPHIHTPTHYKISYDNHSSIRTHIPNKIVTIQSSTLSLRRSFAVAHVLGLWVRISPRILMSFCCDCCVLSVRGLCDEPISVLEVSYRTCVCVCECECVCVSVSVCV
jgi:hypothetical protein